MPVETVTVHTRALAKNAVWIEVSLDRIQKNLEKIQQKIKPYTRVMAVVKANAYGHGLVPVAQALAGKVDFLGIGSLKEASQLREQGVTTPLFLFGRLFKDEIPIALQMRLTLTVSSYEEAKAIAEVNGGHFHSRRKKIPIHIKVDTGMGRLGIPLSHAFSEIVRIALLPNLQLEGIYTHFPTAESYPDPFTVEQLANFEKLIEDLRRKKISFVYRHAANSAGAVRFNSTYLNLVRPGIALYGIYPHSSLVPEIHLEPAMMLKSRIAFTKRISAGDSVGYGREYVASCATSIGIVPVGYAHGYPFHLSGKGEILNKGKRVKLAGRVCMDSLMVDLGHTEAHPGDEVVLLGASGDESISAEEMAYSAGTIPYEIVTRLDAGISRLYHS